MRSVFFLPVFNQVEQLAPLLAELSRADRACDEILLIDNGCTDGSSTLIEQSGFPFIAFDRNRGVGGACMAALEWAIAHRFEIFGAMAANGKMLPAEMPRLLAPIESGAVDYVTGSRFLRDGSSPNLPRFRRTAIPLVTWAVRLITGASISDATCGYRAFRLDILSTAEFDWRAPWLEGYGLEYYLYAKVLLSRTIRWAEVPVTMRYPQSRKSYTKIRPVTGWYDMLKPWLIARIDGKGFAR